MNSGKLRGVLASLLVSVLCACGGGGGGDSSPPAPTGAATIGATGGTVQAPTGASVVVPAGALASDVTIRIAKDSTGAPPVPAGLIAAGDVYAITPHGTRFLDPAEVRIPVPTVSLQPNQAIGLMKAEPGGDWVLLAGVEQRGGMLVAPVSEFSFFLPVLQTFSLTVTELAPLQVSWRIECLRENASTFQLCTTQPDNVRVSWTVFGNQFPSYCPSQGAALKVQVGDEPAARTFPVTSGSATVLLLPQAGTETARISAWLQCGDGRSDSWFSDSVQFAPIGTDRILRVRWDLRVTAVEGTPVTLTHVYLGGHYGAELYDPNQGIIDWERSDDGGRSWRIIARSYQIEADRNPFGTGPVGLYWGVSHRFIATAADHNAQIRSRACYAGGVASAAGFTNCQISLTMLSVVGQATVPTVQSQPRPVMIRTGQTASFAVTASGIPEPTLQWQTRPANSSGDWTAVTNGAGATAANFTTPVLTMADTGQQYRVVATNAGGSTASAVVTVSVSDVDVPPAITAQPVSTSVRLGSDATLAIAARGTEPLSFQWRRNGSPIAGANSPVLLLPAATDTSAGSYDVVVTNPAGSATSSAATLSVQPGGADLVAPTIVTPPASVTVNAGNTATFAVGAGGTGPYTYQWLRNDTPIPGATLAYYRIAAAATGDAGSYSVTVGNATGSTVTSAAATLTVNAAPAQAAVSITTQPAPQVVLPGGTAVFAVAASGTGPLQYQWFKGGVVIAGQTSPVLQLAGVSGTDAGQYAVAVTNALGTVTSDPATLIVSGAPAISLQPAAITATEGAAATFSVTATGTDLRYQWSRNGVAISGAVNASYTTPILSAADNGAAYAVVVYNGAGIAFSNSALLTVTTAPVASAWTSPAIVGLGDNGQPAAGLDGARNSLAVWPRFEGGRGRMVARRGSVADDWRLAVQIDDTLPAEADSFEPQLAVNASGAAMAVWGYGLRGTVEFHVAAARFDGATWRPAERIDTLAGQATGFRVGMDRTGRAVAVYRQFNGSRRAIYGRFHDGNSWSPDQLIDGGSNSGDAAMTVDAQGRGWVAITDAGQVKVAAVDLVNGSFTAPVTIGAALSPRDPSVSVDASGGAIVTWVAGAASGQDLMAARFAGGTWQAPERVDNIPAGQPDYGVASAGAGASTVAWVEPDSARIATVFSRQFAPGAGWQAIERRSGLGAGGVARVQVAASSAGRVVVSWVQEDPASGILTAWAQSFGSIWGSAVRVQGTAFPITSLFLPLGTRSLTVGPDGAALLLWTESAGSGNAPAMGAYLP